MSEFFAEGGFGMYPVLLFGVLTVAAAVALLLRPGQRFLSVVMTLGCTTIAAGFLGFCSGAMATVRASEQLKESGDQLRILVVGLGESLHPLFLALVLTVLAGLLASIGALMAARSPPASPAAT